MSVIWTLELINVVVRFLSSHVEALIYCFISVFISSACQGGDYPRGLMAHTRLISSGSFSEISTFMPGLKSLMQIATQLRVWITAMRTPVTDIIWKRWCSVITEFTWQVICFGFKKWLCRTIICLEVFLITWLEDTSKGWKDVIDPGSRRVMMVKFVCCQLRDMVVTGSWTRTNLWTERKLGTVVTCLPLVWQTKSSKNIPIKTNLDVSWDQNKKVCILSGEIEGKNG